ncbi:MAG: diadenylate cyclase CdaA [Bacteroidaceae bacterium]|nr:diadenylate cyclase CdaA [Prevotellaceae bacterium]MDY5632439.1 diadenylate cyclase CdaA [Bacteroidaceae bacterium]
MQAISIKDILDIVLVALIMYYVYRLLRHTRSAYVFYGVLTFVFFWIVVSQILEMKLLGTLLNQLINVGVIALIVLFQEDIRRVLYSIGSSHRFRRIMNHLKNEKNTGRLTDDFRNDRDTIIPIVMACINMSKQKVGALIVMENDIKLTEFERTGEELDAKISQRLLENIFFKNSPLHDGATIIQGGKVRSAACILPISHDLDIPKDFGLRHRAARGISHETDALAVVVSEETGNITVAYSNQFQSHITAEELEIILMKGRF